MKTTPEKGTSGVNNERKSAGLHWRRPEVRRLQAGAAEQGGTAVTDLGVSFS
jgi:hypothetical protein